MGRKRGEMMDKLEEIIEKVPVFESHEKKETFLIVLSALSIRLISLSKAAEVIGMSKEGLLGVLDSLGFQYSYLEKSDVEIERNWQ